MTQIVPDTTKQVLTFNVYDQLFGVPVEVVQDVFYTPSTTTIPLASNKFKGLLNLRGRTVAAIDLRAYLGFPSFEEREKNMSFLIESASEYYCFIVDKIDEVIQIDPKKCDSASSSYCREWHPISSYVYKLPESLMVILDPYRILNDV